MPGRRYLVSGASFELRTAVGPAARGERAPPARRGSHRARWPAAPAAVAGLAARLLRRDGRICPETVRTLLHGHRFDASLAERELGLVYTPVETTIRRTLAWYAERGLAPPPLG